MPNLKIHVEEATLAPCRDGLVAALPALRDLLCQRLGVAPSACQLAVLPVLGLPDQPPVNVELSILPGVERTRDRLVALAEAIRSDLEPLTQSRVAVRISQLDAATYVALK